MIAQLDLFADHAALDEREARRHAKAAADAAHRAALEVDCCTGDPVEPLYVEGRRIEQYRCGRCGELCPRGSFSTNHDRGYCGCPAETGPRILHVDITTGRHDERHHPSCVCGHPWGIHGRHDEAAEYGLCWAYCGCIGYRMAVAA